MWCTDADWLLLLLVTENSCLNMAIELELSSLLYLLIKKKIKSINIADKPHSGRKTTCDSNYRLSWTRFAERFNVLQLFTTIQNELQH